MKVAAGGNGVGYYPPKRRVTSKTTNPPIQFGFGGMLQPLSLFRQVLATNVAKSMLDDIETFPKLDDLLKKNKHFVLASQNVKSAKAAHKQESKWDALKQAEEKYKKAAVEQPYKILAATCWIYAACCAKSRHNDQGVVDELCKEAEKALKGSREEILIKRAELMKPRKLSSLVRLIFSSPCWAILAPVHQCFKPNHWTEQTRAFLIKISYGQEELARVQRNEELAKHFNSESQKLLDKLSQLRASSKDSEDKLSQATQSDPIEQIEQIDDPLRQTDDSMEPIEQIAVPLFGSCSDMWKSVETSLTQKIGRSIAPYKPTNRSKTAEDMV